MKDLKNGDVVWVPVEIIEIDATHAQFSTKSNKMTKVSCTYVSDDFNGYKFLIESACKRSEPIPQEFFEDLYRAEEPAKYLNEHEAHGYNYRKFFKKWSHILERFKK